MMTENQVKPFPYKYIVLGFPILLSLFAGIPAFIAIKTNDSEYQAASRVAEAKTQLKEIVDLILKQNKLNPNLLELGYRPEGKLANVYGLNPKCFPKIQNTNLIEVSKLSQPVPLFKWDTLMTKNLNLIEEKLVAQPCNSKEGKVLIYALYMDDMSKTKTNSENKQASGSDDKPLVKGWSIDLEKNISILE